MTVLVVGNQKGGVGKSTMINNLGAAIAERGRRVLLVDLDGQATLTRACGLADADGRGMAEVMGGVQAGTLVLGDIVRNLGPGLDLAPSDIALSHAELLLAGRLGRETVLRRALGSVAGYDLVLIDTPPSLGLLTVNALVAADWVLIPTAPMAADLAGVRLFLDTIGQIREALNPDLQLLGIALTFWDARLRHSQQALGVLQAAGLPMFETRIGRTVRIAEAMGLGESVLTYAPRNRQSGAYRDLAGEVLQWLENNRR